MKKFFLTLVFILALCSISNAQPSSVATTIRFGSSLPSTCQPTGSNIFYRNTTGILYTCTATNTWTAVGSSGTVTSVSVVSANGFAGSVATATTTPAITISTTITGLLKGNGTAISAASSGTDYIAPGGALLTLNAGTNVGLTVPGAIVQGATAVVGNTSDTVRFTSLGLGQAAPTAGLSITGKTISTDVDGTTSSISTTSTLTKNDSNTRTFQSVQIKPTFNTGGSNANTTVDILQIDSTNTAVTGLIVNLLDLMYGGTSQFSVNSSGNVVFGGAAVITGGAGNMTVTSGTGNSRTLTLRTTDSGGTAQNAISIGATQISTFLGSVVMPSLTITGVWIQNASNMRAASGQYWGFSSASDNSAISDVTLSRGNVGVLNIGTGTTTSNGAVAAGSAYLSSTTDSTTTTSGALQVAGGAAIRKRVFIDGITASAGLQTAVLCQSSGGEMIADTVACLASSARFKENIKPLNVGLDEVMKLKPVSYKYKPEGIFAKNLNFKQERVGLIAEEVAKIDPRFVGFEADNLTPRTVGYDAMVPLLIKAIQELQVEILDLKHKYNNLNAKLK